jgi:hypothetical protein
MKRDFDLIRTMLLQIENDKVPNTEEWEIDGYDYEIIEFHLEYLEEEGMITKHHKLPHKGRYGVFNWKGLRLTSFGYNYLDGVREIGRWNQVKKEISNAGNALSLSNILAIIGLVKDLF